jgi:hypothetical protein
MRLKRFVAIPLGVLAACGAPTPAEQMDSIQSWLATAEMVGHGWLRHTTPDRYSRETLELSHQTLAQISGELLKNPPRSVDSASLDSALTGSLARVGAMSRLIESKDAPGFSHQLDSLQSDERAVKQLASSIKAGQ